ncbi:hypothetical protein [Paenibacillus alvei]|uniref:hypothetical protein n=1 Tax=Paenibacillus alvei TaxID=44250 RepID=UPI000288ADCB|nr:hypothetical protein [Paenibacillus alvei]EJW14698.1 hypothetical protein PAV_11c00390 [Paenibacillus alvei DSM 29]MCY9544665.1 hypothetical protein [Paenibacillus alvei]MCY9704945.1 hypothetical protein [Paenibacillus alvei]MEC0080170.1 hypothetical protein [Paenibacillus alvei]NEZ43289.1 hypothetical protein [Paenibacillus alvei]
MITTKYVVRSKLKKFGSFLTQEAADAAVAKIKKRNPRIKQLEVWPEAGNWQPDCLKDIVYDDMLK